MVKTITVGISGASGAIYAQRLLVQLEDSPEVRQINVVISGPGRRVISDELDVSSTADSEQIVAEMIGRSSTKAIVFHPGDIGAAIASGSYPVDAVVIIPCSASTLGVLASGGLSHFLVDEDFDRAILKACADKDAQFLKTLPRNKLHAGSSEILNWVAVAGAVEHLDFNWFEYVPGYRTPAGTGTGLSFATWA